MNEKTEVRGTLKESVIGLIYMIATISIGIWLSFLYYGFIG